MIRSGDPLPELLELRPADGRAELRLPDQQGLQQAAMLELKVRQHAQLLEGAYGRSEEHTSELQSLMRISYAVFCLKKKNNNYQTSIYNTYTTQNIAQIK